MSESNDLEQLRSEKVRRLREAGVDPYPPRVERTHTSLEAARAFEAAPEGTTVSAAVVGRLRSVRRMGKASFAHLEDGPGRLQIYLKQDEVGAESYERFHNALDLGDFVQARGTLFRTKTGEVSLHVQSWAVVAKAILPLPAPKDEVVEGKRVVHSAFADPEARFRQRYLDLALNPETRQVFHGRARVVSGLREFLDARGFLEVETPILQPLYGGAAARPFTTHHNQLHQDLYLRISFELYLKRLLIGNLERVYEIGRDFRNEGVDRTHNPEFTQLEFYQAYADYRDVMALAEEMFAAVAQHVTGSTQITYQGKSIDLKPPWRRLELRAAIAETAGIDLTDHKQADSLRAEMRRRGMDPSPDAPRGKLIETLMENALEPTLVQPAFVYDYPRDISPLAKSKTGDPDTVERFEGFAGGMELCNAFTELNDPEDQRARFLEMAKAFGAEDEERHPMDEDYLRAMGYGMPPCGGFGMGVDRLVMLLTDQPSIREVILFPHLRSKDT
ncbi:MAG: lysine--tRNA ligase [Anaerolineales bacterium]